MVPASDRRFGLLGHRILRAALRPAPGVVGVHDLHAWQITAGLPMITAHVIAADGADHHQVLHEVDSAWPRTSTSATARPGWSTSRAPWSRTLTPEPAGRVLESAVPWTGRADHMERRSVEPARGNSKVKLFELYRYAKPDPGADVEYIDGIRNLFNATRWPAWPGLAGAGRVQLDHGIDSVALVRAIDGTRRPAIMIASKPHRAGSDWTPWHDELDPNAGHVRYFGDNKAELGLDPDRATGNRSILDEFILHRSNRREQRLAAAPLLFFESIIHEGRAKGFWRFIGLGVLERAERVTQIDRQDRLFANYAFDCALVDLGPENLRLAWEWIAARRDPTWTLEGCLNLAPANWRRWVEQGSSAIDRIRQSVARYHVLQPTDQRPDRGTPAEDALRAVVDHYKTGPAWTGVGEHRFEALASEVVGTQLNETGRYRRGWITKRGGDGGIDFVGRLDLGTTDSGLKLVVLGQAKCKAGVAPATGGVDLARTVARLARGWVGAFVTTGYYTEQAQREVISDHFPLLLVNGRQVGEAVVRNAAIRGLKVPDYIRAIDAEYDDLLSSRLPEEILAEGLPGS